MSLPKVVVDTASAHKLFCGFTNDTKQAALKIIGGGQTADGNGGHYFFWIDHDSEEISKTNGRAIVRVVDVVECITY